MCGVVAAGGKVASAVLAASKAKRRTFSSCVRIAAALSTVKLSLLITVARSCSFCSCDSLLPSFLPCAMPSSRPLCSAMRKVAP